ncbi:hypothetical protein EYF80_050500 [Liparis tanakae]|uniref:Uncharacterized protein n=1 Tax=Liparis tanakae TaxID=230148 RepID=A0A4Z2FEL7_9TELE|nr:hypothetical protein EYF80_050500 [Liparis tanakae]
MESEEEREMESEEERKGDGVRGGEGNGVRGGEERGMSNFTVSGGVRHGEQVGRVLVQLAAAVRVHAVLAVDVHLPVRVDGDHHLPDVGVDAALLEPVPDKRGHRRRRGQ